MEKVLTRVNPVLKCYPNYAHIFSIVGAYTENYLPWVYNHFMQLFVPNCYEAGIRIDYVTPHMLKSFPWIDVNHIERKIVSDKWENIIEFIKDYIDKQYYIYALFDVSQIDLYQFSKFRTHDPLIYGYNDDKRLIYFADNFKDGKYSNGCADYSEIINATNTLTNRIDITDWLDGFNCIKYKEKYDFGNCRFSYQYNFNFNKELYLNLLTDYVEQKNSYRRWCAPQNLVEIEDSNIWGTGIYAFLQKYLEYVINNEQELDQRGFYVFMEHKVLLKNSVEYLLGRQWKLLYFSEWYLMEDCVAISTIIFNLCLKYNIVLKKEIIKRISLRLYELEKKEKELIERLIYIIDKNKYN